MITLVMSKSVSGVNPKTDLTEHFQKQQHDIKSGQLTGLELELVDADAEGELEWKIAKQIQQLNVFHLLSKIELKKFSFQGVQAAIKALVAACVVHGRTSDQPSIL